MSQTPGSDAQHTSWQESSSLPANAGAVSNNSQPSPQPDAQISTLVAPGQASGQQTPLGDLPSSPPASPARQRGKDTTIIVSILTVLLIVGGTILGTTTFNNYQGTLRANAAATAQVANATATQVMVTAQAQATATAVDSHYPFSTNQVINDPLVDNNRGLGWDVDQTPTSGCFFSNGAYHVTENQVNRYNICAAGNTNFSDFTFQADMVINQGGTGTGGGLIFRANENNLQFYRLVVDNAGNYFIQVILAPTGVNGNVRTLKQGTVTGQFAPGFGQTNTLGIVAGGSRFSFYVNGLLVASFTDSTYTQGQIGFDAGYGSSSTDVAFTNAKVWLLSGTGAGSL